MIAAFADLNAEQLFVAGGKGGTLARLFQAGFPVPDGFVILPQAFQGDELRPAAWRQVLAQLEHLRVKRPGGSLAVRSSALAEDAAEASFAGEFETVLGVYSDAEVREAIQTVRRSRRSERVQAYSLAKGLDTTHEIAVLVQSQITARFSGVLFTADPMTGSREKMIGNFVCGVAERLVSGEATGESFTFERPGGKYQGPPELRRAARKLYKLAASVEKELGRPQDIEWAIGERRLFLLQSRPITTLIGNNRTTGQWNDSLAGDYLWSNVNIGEAVSDVMTPFTWSGLYFLFDELTLIPGHHPLGNIGGRPYNNISVVVSAFHALGSKAQEMIDELYGGYDRFPDGMTPPGIPVSRSARLPLLRNAIRIEWKQRKALMGARSFLSENPAWCRRMMARVQATQTVTELADIWLGEVGTYVLDAFWRVIASAIRYAQLAGLLRKDLIKLADAEQAQILLSGVSSAADNLASLGPVLGVWKIARGEMTRQEFLEKFGHRGPHEGELFFPHPIEDPTWLDQQIKAFEDTPIDVEGLLAKRLLEFDTAWERFQSRNPRKAKSIAYRLEKAREAAILREAIRSEFVRISMVSRACAVRAGELTGLGEGIFFLYFDEIEDLLRGEPTPATQYVAARRKTYDRYRALPLYPPVIRGRFDPFAWAADPDRRSDFFDSHIPDWPAAPGKPRERRIVGSPGSAGKVEGNVRRIDQPEDGDQLQEAEILVSRQTNIGWTLLFPRAAAVVTDVGAPLSHAAIVARELGIPAVVGCGDATRRLKTGDRVRVDGGRGIVEILEEDGK